MSSTTATLESPRSSPQLEQLFAQQLPPGADSSRPVVAGEDVRKPGGAASNTAVHVDLHNLWTSRWTEPVTVWRPRGTTGRRVLATRPSPAGRPCPGCGRKKVGNSPDIRVPGRVAATPLVTGVTRAGSAAGERHEGRRTGVRRPSWAVLGAAWPIVSRRRR